MWRAAISRLTIVVGDLIVAWQLGKLWAPVQEVEEGGDGGGIWPSRKGLLDKGRSKYVYVIIYFVLCSLEDTLAFIQQVDGCPNPQDFCLTMPHLVCSKLTFEQTFWEIPRAPISNYRTVRIIDLSAIEWISHSMTDKSISFDRSFLSWQTQHSGFSMQRKLCE